MIEELSNKGIRRDLERYRGTRFGVEPTPPWTTRRKVMNIERRPGDPVTILLFDRQIHAPSNSRYTRIVRRLETHQAVQDLGTVEFNFDPATQKLVVHAVSVFRSGNLANHAVESAFELFQREAGLEQDILNGALTALLILRDIRNGDVLDLEFSILSDSPLLGDHYSISEAVENTYPIGRQWLSWIEREGQELFVQAPSDPNACKREITDQGTVRTWNFEQTRVIELEPDLPAFYRPFAEISITTFNGWGQVVSLFLEPWAKEPANRTELDIELQQLRERFMENQDAGIAAATDLVRHQIRYLGYSPGVFALIPADPSEVWQRRFGDCKEKSRLLCWLLRELGLDAVPVLVHTVWGQGLNEMPASPGDFNHVVVRLKYANRKLWIDPTDVARRGKITQWSSLPFHFGLPLESGSDQLVRIPSAPHGSAGLTVEENVLIDSKSNGGDIRVSHTYRMGDADNIRHVMDSKGRSTLADYLTDQVRRTRPDAQPISELEVMDDPTENVLVIQRNFRCEELLRPSTTDDAGLFFLVPHSIPPRVTGVSANRKYPLAIHHPVDVTHTIRVNPDDPRKVKIPAISIKNEFFNFTFQTSVSRTESIHTFVFQTLTNHIPASKTRLYSNELSKIAEALEWHLRLPPRKSSRFRMRPRREADPW